MLLRARRRGKHFLSWSLTVLLIAACSPDQRESEQAVQLFLAGRHVEAEALLRRTLGDRQAAPGPEQQSVARSLNEVGKALRVQGRHAEAEAFHRRALAVQESALGREHPDVATSLNDLAYALNDQGRHAEAEALLRRALAIRETALGPGHPDVAGSLNNLANVLNDQGRHAEAEALHRRALAILEKALGPEHPRVAGSLSNLAVALRVQGRYTEAEVLHRRALAIREATLGPEHLEVAASLNNLAVTLREQGRYTEAEALDRRALAISETALGPERPEVAASLNALGGALQGHGRHAEAEALHRRALATQEVMLGPGHPEVAASLNNVAISLDKQGRYAEAEALHRRALAIREATLGPEHPEVAQSLNNVAASLYGQGRHIEAEALHRRALAIRQAALGAEHPEVGQSLHNIAITLDGRGQYAEAEALHRRALAIREAALGPEHPDVALSLDSLANSLHEQGRDGDALWLSRRALTALRAAEANGDDLEHVGRSYVRIAWKVAQREPGQVSDLTEESFEAAQIVAGEDVVAALAQVAARFAAGDDDLAVAVRSRQDLERQRQEIDRRLLAGYAAGGATADRTQLIGEFRSASDRLERMDASLTERFPAYAELTDPRPVPARRITELLAADEALVSYMFDADRGGVLLWVVRSGRVKWGLLDLTPEELTDQVRRLRAALDPGQGGGGRRPFPVAEAAALRRLLLPNEATVLAGARHLFIVPDGPLQSLPFAVLAGQESASNAPDWLVERYATTTLPAVSSLKALRLLQESGRGKAPFAGVGDPVLEGGGTARGIATAALYDTRGLADPAKLRALPPLPATRRELERLAAALGAGPASLHLGPAATEANVKAGALADVRVVAFATHAAVAGELEGLAEPALVLTPPANATELDDGLLTASEAAQLKLDAELVLLSACNTAAPDGTPGAVGLSGLAKAFFYAGTRAILVSHWAVYDEAAQALTTGMIESVVAEPDIGLAEALRRSQLAMIHGGRAHPAEWAPFVVVGEGGADRGVLPFATAGR